VRNRLDPFPDRIVGSCFESGKFLQEHPVLVGRGTPTRSRLQPSPTTTPVRHVKPRIYPSASPQSRVSPNPSRRRITHTSLSVLSLVSLVSCVLPLPAPEDLRLACPRPPCFCVLGCWPRLAATTHQAGGREPRAHGAPLRRASLSKRGQASLPTASRRHLRPQAWMV
jgi:hypothetical protein